ncbi:hypothetical protein HYX08_03150 [Candidatus Woesearchaeota archaeon]|nr:hypothetical protein [Candidatus Woesearchaeota archaeon]
MSSQSLRQLLSGIFAAYFSAVPSAVALQPKYECHQYMKGGKIIEEVVEYQRIEGMELLFRVNASEISLPDYSPFAPKCNNPKPELKR